jgi:hypothetical protein
LEANSHANRLKLLQKRDQAHQKSISARSSMKIINSAQQSFPFQRRNHLYPAFSRSQPEIHFPKSGQKWGKQTIIPREHQ